MFGPLRRAVAIAAAVVMIAVVIWVDVMTPVWQNLVIISGLVAGAVTFLLTTLFIDRFIQRAARRRWAPVTRMTLTEILHQLSDASGDGVGPRRLPTPDATSGPQVLLAGTKELRSAVIAERRRLSTALVTWWALLSSIPDTEEIIRHTADVALLFDGVRNASLDLDQAVTSGATTGETEAAERTLRSQIMACNHSIACIIEEISARLAQDQTELSSKAQQTLTAMHQRIVHE